MHPNYRRLLARRQARFARYHTRHRRQGMFLFRLMRYYRPRRVVCFNILCDGLGDQ
jgi:hypothetical protein